MRNPYFVGRPPGIYNIADLTMKEKLARTGGNTGNILFISSLHKQVEYSTPTDHSRFDPAIIRERHDGVIIPAANWFNYYSDWGGLADKIKETGLPCVISGLGAQSHSEEIYPKPTPGTLKLVKIISERSASLSVRGDYTASALAKYGITNVSVTGCPSLLWRGKPLKVEKKASLPSKIGVGTTRSDGFEKVFDPSPAFQCSIFLGRLAYSHKYDYIAQSELFDMQISRDAASEEREVAASEANSRENLAYLGRIFDDSNFKNVISYSRDHIRVFFNIESWIEYNRGLDFYLGTRLHGVIAALLAGIPAMLVVHDTRTLEMAHLLGLPMIRAEDFVQMTQDKSCVERLYQQMTMDVFNSRQMNYFRNFEEFFEKNGVETKLQKIEARV